MFVAADGRACGCDDKLLGSPTRLIFEKFEGTNLSHFVVMPQVGPNRTCTNFTFGPNDDEGHFWHESTNGFMNMILPIFKRDSLQIDD